MQELDVFAVERSRARRQFAVRMAAAGLVLAALCVTFLLWPSAQKDLEAASGQIAERRDQYCAVWEAMNAADPGDVSGSGEQVILAGTPDLHTTEYSQLRAGANADTIEYSALSTLCGSERRQEDSVLFGGVLARLSVDPTDRDVGDFDRESVALALQALSDMEYLLVLRVGSYLRSEVEGSVLDPGSLTGVASVYRLNDATLIGRVSLDLHAPDSATALVIGHVLSAERSVNLTAHENYRRAIAAEFYNHRVSLVVE